MSRYTVVYTQKDGYRVEDNEAEHDTPARILDINFVSPGEAEAYARRLNREAEEKSGD
jgi:hypothetical protein